MALRRNPNDVPEQKASIRSKWFRKATTKVFKSKDPELNPQVEPILDCSEGADLVISPEIWARIFQFVCEDAFQEAVNFATPSQPLAEQYACPVSPTIHLAPVRLSQVCRYWNDMVILNPLFWRNIFILTPTSSPEKQLATWFSRGKSLTTSLTFDARYFLGSRWGELREPGKESLNECIRTILQHSSSIEDLSLYLCQESISTWIEVLDDSTTESLEVDFQNLHSVQIRMDKSIEIEVQNLISKLFSIAPNVSSLTFKNHDIGDWQSVRLRTDFDSSTIFTSESLAQLTTLTLHEVTIPNTYNLLTYLSQLPALNALWLISVSIPRRRLPEDRVTLKSLQELHLVHAIDHPSPLECCDVNLIPFLSGIIVPCLVSLEVDMRGIGGYEAWRVLLEMISVSGCVIRSLELTPWTEFSSEEWDVLVSGICSGLEELTLHYRAWIKDDTIRLLDRGSQPQGLDFRNHRSPSASTSSTAPIFPLSLKRLVLLGCDTKDGLLAQVATSRMRHGSLEFLYTEVKDLYTGTHHSQDLDTLIQLRRAGYKAYIRPAPNLPVKAGAIIRSSGQM